MPSFKKPVPKAKPMPKKAKMAAKQAADLKKSLQKFVDDFVALTTKPRKGVELASFSAYISRHKKSKHK